MLKVAMISTLPPQKTGESSYTANLIHGLSQYESIKIIAIAGKDAENLHSNEGRIETLRIWNGRDPRYPFALFKRILKRRPHIVHVQFGPHGEIYGGLFGEWMLLLLLLLRLAGIRTTVTSHSTWLAKQVIERVRTYNRLRSFSIFAPTLFKLYMKLLYWGSSLIQLSTVRIESELRLRFQREYGFDEDRIVEMPHPCQGVVVTKKMSEAKQEIGVKDRKVVLVFGFIRRGKGLGIAIKAMQIVKETLPDTTLLIVGTPIDSDGHDYLNELLHLKDSLNLNQNAIFHTKYIPNDQVLLYFSAASIILVPYTESVGASGPVHNYAGYGRPIIASDVGHHMREALGGTLTLFKNGNSEDLADKVVTLLKNDGLRQKLSKKQCNYVESETWDVAAKRTLRHYASVILRK